MRTVHDWLSEYATSHRHPVNRKLHLACIPPIVFSVLCALKTIPIGDDRLNAATVGALMALAYYFRLSWRLALGASVVVSLFYAGVVALDARYGPSLVWIAGAIFVASWVVQLVGHRVEGAHPSFFNDLQFFLIGPLWEIAVVYRALGLPVAASDLP